MQGFVAEWGYFSEHELNELAPRCGESGRRTCLSAGGGGDELEEIQQALESGDKRITVRLLESMTYELGLRQRGLSEFLRGVKRGD